MEKSTKALIFSGAVLVSILVISLAVMIINKNSSDENVSTTLNRMEIMKFNEKYELLQGKHKGSTVKTVLGYAISDNQSLQGAADKRGDTIDICVNIRSNDKDILDKFRGNGEMYRALTTREYGVRYVENIADISSVVQVNKTYNIWYSYNDYGLIWEIHIDEP